MQLAAGYGQSGKFKTVHRTPVDSTAVRTSAKDGAQVIDGSKDIQVRSGSNDGNGENGENGANGVGESFFPAERLEKPDAQSPHRRPFSTPHPRPVFIERERIELRSSSGEPASDTEIARTFFRETPSLHIPRPETQIRIDKTDTDSLGIRHLKGVQIHRGIPVYGMEFTFHISSRSERFIGYTLDTVRIDTAAAHLDAQQAIAIAEKDLGIASKTFKPGTFTSKLLNYSQPSAELVYYPSQNDTYRLCYRVTVRPNIRDEWIYSIDAQSGEVIEKYNNTPSTGPTSGSGRDVNSVQRTVPTYEEVGTHYMVNTTKPMFDGGSFTGTIMVLDAHNNPDIYGDSPSVTVASSSSAQWNNANAISAMYHSSMIYDYLRQTLGRNSFDGEGADMGIVINVPDEDGKSYDNAFWNGKVVALGNGDVAFSSLAGGLDVTAHEFGHAVVDFTARLEYRNQSGAINEGYADIFGSMVDRDDWTIGETIVKSRAYFPTGALRDMADPHNGGNGLDDNGWQPAHVSEMYLGSEDNGGVHVNSGIPNHAFYTYAAAASREKAEKVFYRALSNYLTPVSRFIDLRIAAMQSARDLYGDADAQLVAKAFDRVGVLEDTGSTRPTDLPVNPGQQGLLVINTDPSDGNTLYRTPDYSNFTPVSASPMSSTPSVTDDGRYLVFVDGDHNVRLIDMTAGRETDLVTDGTNAGVALSRDGNRMAVVSTEEDASIWVYDFDSEKWTKFRLYNPTTGMGGAQSGGVRYADAIEFDHTGEFIIYDAYNVVGKSFFSDELDYWDIGVIQVWDNKTNRFGSGRIEKLFTALDPGMNVANPTFSKNSPHIIAFDYMDTDGTFAVLSANLATGELDGMFGNNYLSYPNYSMDDKHIAFMTLDESDETFTTGYYNLQGSKMTVTGDPALISYYSAFPVYYGTGKRQLGVKPVAAFAADYHAGVFPLAVQFVDQSEGEPTSWNWTFQGGTPSSSTLQHPRIIYNTPGTYPVRLTATNSYGSHETVKQAYIRVGTVGTEMIENPPLTLFPNPVSDVLHVKGIAADGLRSIGIFDMTGRALKINTFAAVSSSFSTAATANASANVSPNASVNVSANASVSHSVNSSFYGSDLQVDVSDLPRGIYFLRLALHDGTVRVGKFVKR
jgi:Zn-dependent metalloprotease/PKD repeat protein